MSSPNRESTGALAGLLAGNLEQSAVNRYFGRVIPVFALLLLVTAVVIVASIETGLASALFAEFGLLAFGGLLVGQLLVFFAARAFRQFFPLNVVFAFLLFSAFILYDMSSILEDDFDAVSGAIMLYLDFVLIFVHLLSLLGELDG